MTWNEFKQAVEDKLAAKNISPEEEIAYIDISFNEEIFIELLPAGITVSDSR